MISKRIKKELPLHLMVFPALILVIIYCYVPMAGISMAFQKYVPVKGILGSKWIGLDNFKFLFSLPDFTQVLYNTIFISVMKIIAGLIIPIIIALLLNEISKDYFKRTIQTMVYLPYFLSWVILAGILIDFLSPQTGIVNQVLGNFGIKPIYFLGDNKWFPITMVVTGTWQTFGFNTIVYLAALTGIDPSLYEAAVMDGANRWRQTWHITLPGIKPIIILLLTLSLGQVLNAGFDQIFNMYNSAVLQSGDILDTMIYRTAFADSRIGISVIPNYGLATAAGMFKSVISFGLISISYWLAYKLADYRIF